MSNNTLSQQAYKIEQVGAAKKYKYNRTMLYFIMTIQKVQMGNEQDHIFDLLGFPL